MHAFHFLGARSSDHFLSHECLCQQSKRHFTPTDFDFVLGSDNIHHATHLTESWNVNLVTEGQEGHSKHLAFHRSLHHLQRFFLYLRWWSRFLSVYHCFQPGGVEVVGMILWALCYEGIDNAIEFAPHGSLRQAISGWRLWHILAQIYANVDFF